MTLYILAAGAIAKNVRKAGPRGRARPSPHRDVGLHRGRRRPLNEQGLQGKTMIRKPHSIPSAIALACVASLLAACGGSGGSGGTPPPTYTISGTISGLKGSAVLHNAGDTVTVNGDGSFSFPTPVQEGSEYDAQVQSLQFASQTCLVANGTGIAN